MSSYGWLERSLARALRRLPHAKAHAKGLYQRLNYLIYRKSAKSEASAPFRAVDPTAHLSYFGYYDRSPESEDGHILFHRQALMGSGIELAIFDASGRPVCSAETNVSNWQQGARALWVGDRFVFNRWNSDRSVVTTVLQELDGLQVTLDAAVQDAFRDQYLLGIDYARVTALQPEYGYAIPAATDIANGAGGITRTDLTTGETRLLFSFDQARALDASWQAPRRDFFNHVMISPDGSRLLVLHRWYENGVRSERLLLGTADGSELKVLVDAGMVSHCAWADDHTILSFMRAGGGHEGYWLLDAETGATLSLSGGTLDRFGDGHPSVHGDWFITDTYPDKSAQQTLILGNWKTGAWQTIGSFFHPLHLAGAKRCDLHPRWSPDGNRIYFDSAFSGARTLYVMDLDPNCFPS